MWSVQVRVDSRAPNTGECWRRRLRGESRGRTRCGGDASGSTRTRGVSKACGVRPTGRQTRVTDAGRAGWAVGRDVHLNGRWKLRP